MILSTHSIISQQIDLPEIEYSLINSFPQNALVFLNGSYIGSTPCRFTKNAVDTVNKNDVVVKLKGYHDFNFSFVSSDLPVNKSVNLVPVRGALDDYQIVQKNKLKLFNTPRKMVPVVLSGILTVGSAALSYYFKRVANERYDEYLISGDPNTLNKTKKYDLYSGIGLGAFEVSFVSLLYFLLIK